jgi:ABC-2 type transport system permease protein
MKASLFKALYWKEFTSYFKSPLGYVFLVIFLFASSYLAFEPGRGSFFLMRQASLSSFFRYIPWTFLFLIPAVSMRLWAEERKTGTIELLLTFPISLTQATLAKFLAAWSFVGVVLLGSFPMVLTVLYLGTPDLGVIFLGYLSCFLVAGALLAVGLFFSALTKNQVVAFILTSVTSFVLLMAGSPPVLEFVSAFLPKFGRELFESLSVLNHFESMERGVLGLADLWFFLAMMVCWLAASVVALRQTKTV